MLAQKALTPWQQYLLVTLSYWSFTLTDGALRMLVVLHFNSLGYSPFAIAMLFVLYEVCGVVTNLLGGWLATRLGLNRTMHAGLLIQIVALFMLAVPDEYLTVVYVMLAQALSGIAKDLNKMSAKSAIKTLLPEEQQGRLYRWVALLTGSKNALKGVGFFMGAVLLQVFGFAGSLMVMAGVLVFVLILTASLVCSELGQMKVKPKFLEIFSNSQSVNVLSAARLFLFGARDIWFVVALPVYLQVVLGWEHTDVGTFLAVWVIGYGVVQVCAPAITGSDKTSGGHAGVLPGRKAAFRWVSVLSMVPFLMLLVAMLSGGLSGTILVTGLLVFGAVFAVNSSLHSYLILRYARTEGASLDVGFYYMSNAAGRLLGTVLSGGVYQVWGLEACLLVSALCLMVAAAISLKLPEVGTAA
ncbi:organoarsenical effux MFS transporter ArsJ [Aliamphritea hakodatensis]|uniref:organoarsenical effux MFS transporter ArsJ n=1 Tax=Aliamphritea hakodatensis TaxID=2895352 RepID=UPI0022FD63D8|nr:organoarsenical effux MFS transporter ArsJ [Aliamphritea hakodatensis]